MVNVGCLPRLAVCSRLVMVQREPVEGTRRPFACTSMAPASAGWPRTMLRAWSITTFAPSRSKAALMMSCGGFPQSSRQRPTVAPP